jgi:hypothetical protein
VGEAQYGSVWKVMPWPYSHDTNGIAYPSGLKALVGSVPDADVWDGDWEAYCIANNPTLICVPDSLPSGYRLNNKCGSRTYAGDGPIRVKNLARFYRCGSRVDYNFGFPTYVLGDGRCNAHPSDVSGRDFHAPRVWYTYYDWDSIYADWSLREHKWAPMPSMGYGTAPFGNFSGGGGVTGLIGIAFPPFYGAGPEVSFYSASHQCHQGWRYTLARYSSTGTIAGVHVKITRANDWTNPGGPGAVTVCDVTLGSTTSVAAWSDLTIGAVEPPLGTLGWVHIQVWATGHATLSGSMGLTVLAGNRCDIPICCTTTYRDWQDTEHIVPGGYVESILSNPPWDASASYLTGSYTAYQAETHGDGKYVYLQYTGTPSSSHTLYSDGFSAGGVQFFQGNEATGEPQSGSGPPGFGPWNFTLGTDGVAWIIIDVHGENGSAARFKVT